MRGAHTRAEGATGWRRRSVTKESPIGWSGSVSSRVVRVSGGAAFGCAPHRAVAPAAAAPPAVVTQSGFEPTYDSLDCGLLAHDAAHGWCTGRILNTNSHGLVTATTARDFGPIRISVKTYQPAGRTSTDTTGGAHRWCRSTSARLDRRCGPRRARREGNPGVGNWGLSNVYRACHCLGSSFGCELK
jgi:hypothetical protein